MNLNIRYSCTPPSKVYDVIESEKIFFENLYDNFKKENLSTYFSLIRMRDGTLTFEYCGCPVGKIKLQGRKYHMTYMKNLYDYDTVEGDVNEFILYQNKWIKYIKKYLSKGTKNYV